MSRLENFLDEQNRLTAFPAKRRVKLQALCYLAQKFEPGKIYTEKQVNVLLNQWHTFEDPATLRRELYQHRFLGRQPFKIKEERSVEKCLSWWFGPAPMWTG